MGLQKKISILLPNVKRFSLVFRLGSQRIVMVLGFNLDDTYKISQIISAVALVVTSIVSLTVLWITHNLAKSSKRAETLIHCNTRFEEILNLQSNPNVLKEPTIFYRRFWALQFDQFTYWIHGFISDDVFRYWMMERHDQWMTNYQFGGVSYRDGWKMAMTGWTYTKFIHFMEIVHEHSADDAFREYHDRKNIFKFCKPKKIA
jgi:hypothetical protein